MNLSGQLRANARRSWHPSKLHEAEIQAITALCAKSSRQVIDFCSGSPIRDNRVMAPITMTRIDLRNRSLSAAQLRAALPRGGVDVDAVVPKVRPIVDAVAERGAEAALEYGESFDGVRPATGPGAGRRAADAALDRAATPTSAPRSRWRSSAPAPCTPTSGAPTPPPRSRPGATVTERWVPVERVGLYVPGGNAVYPSSVVMNVVPAQTAGVDSLVIASPPQAEFGGLPHPTILAAARAARRRRGVGGRRCAGRRAAGLRRHRHRRRRTGACRHDHRAGQHLRHRRQADLPLAGRHRRRGRSHRDRDPRRPHRRPGARRRRPDQPGRARRDGRQRAGHRQQRCWPTPPTANSRTSWRPPCTASG